MFRLRPLSPHIASRPLRPNRSLSSFPSTSTKTSSVSLKLPQDIQSLLKRLHGQSLKQEEATSDAVAKLRSLRRSDPEAGNAALHNLMRDSFVALDQDKCEFIHQLVLATRARNVVEVGTSFGVSTIYLAAAVARNDARNGRVIATEIEESKAERARKHWEEAGEEIAARIELRLGDLRETLAKDLPEVDFVLLDIWAAMALPALKLVRPSLKKGAVVIIDNTASLPDLYNDLLAYLRDPEGPFTTLTVPYSNGLEMAVYRG